MRRFMPGFMLAAMLAAVMPAAAQVGVIRARGAAEPTSETRGGVTTMRSRTVLPAQPGDPRANAEVFRSVDTQVSRVESAGDVPVHDRPSALRPIGGVSLDDHQTYFPEAYVGPGYRPVSSYYYASGNHSRLLQYGIHKLYPGHLHGRYFAPGHASAGYRPGIYAPGPFIGRRCW